MNFDITNEFQIPLYCLCMCPFVCVCVRVNLSVDHSVEWVSICIIFTLCVSTVEDTPNIGHNELTVIPQEYGNAIKENSLVKSGPVV